MKRKLILLAKVVFTSFLIIYLFRTKGIDLGRSWQFIRDSAWGYLPLAFGLLMLGQFLCSYRWQMILDHLQIRIRLGRLFQFYLIGMFFSLFFPSIVGGDFVKIYYVKKDSGRSLAYGLASVYLERATGFVALLVFGLAGGAASPLSLRQSDFRPLGWLGVPSMPLWIIPAVILALFLGANCFIFNAFLYNWAAACLRAARIGKVADKLALLRDALVSFRRQPVSLVRPLLISHLNIALVVLMNWLIARALKIDVSIVLMAAVVSLMTVLVTLPISINGIGLRENSLVVLLSLAGVAPDHSFALSLVSFLMIVLSGLPGGICYSLLKRELPPPPDEKELELA